MSRFEYFVSLIKSLIGYVFCFMGAIFVGVTFTGFFHPYQNIDGTTNISNNIFVVLLSGVLAFLLLKYGIKWISDHKQQVRVNREHKTIEKEHARKIAEQQETLERDKQRLQYEADMLEIHKQQDNIAAEREHQRILQQQLFEIERRRIIEATEQKEALKREQQLLQHEAEMLEIAEQRRITKKRIECEERLQASIDDEINEVDCMEGHDFEHYCASLLLRNGFDNAIVTKGSGDQGVDVLAEKDGIRYAIQCKNYASKLSNTPVQEVSAGRLFYNCHIAVVMTNSTLSPGAEELAKATNVLVWDRPVLHRLIAEAHDC